MLLIACAFVVCLQHQADARSYWDAMKRAVRIQQELGEATEIAAFNKLLCCPQGTIMQPLAKV
jgi:hypothetical protein